MPFLVFCLQLLKTPAVFFFFAGLQPVLSHGVQRSEISVHEVNSRRNGSNSRLLTASRTTCANSISLIPELQSYETDTHTHTPSSYISLA